MPDLFIFCVRFFIGEADLRKQLFVFVNRAHADHAVDLLQKRIQLCFIRPGILPNLPALCIAFLKQRIGIQTGLLQNEIAQNP